MDIENKNKPKPSSSDTTSHEKSKNLSEQNQENNKTTEIVIDQTDILPYIAKHEVIIELPNKKIGKIPKTDNKQKRKESKNPKNDPDLYNEGSEQSEVKISLKYKKRPGTAAIVGSLYKSHLLSIILYRSLNEEKMDFILGSSVDGIGAMNEICYRFCHDDNEQKPVVVFIQTKYAGYITDDFSLTKCFESFCLIKERFDMNESDALFEGKFDDILLYFVIYTPNHSKMKSHIAVTENDKVFTEKVNYFIHANKKSKIYKFQSEYLIDGLINKRIEYIGKTIVAYVTSDTGDLKEIHEEMKRVLIKYYHFLIPDVIKITKQDENLQGYFSDTLFSNGDNHIKLLKKVLFEEILKNSKVINEEASKHIQILTETNNVTADLLSTLIGNVITFDKFEKKLAYMPGVSEHTKKQSLDNIEVDESIISEAFAIAGEKALNVIKVNIINTDLEDVLVKHIDTKQKTAERFFEDERLLAKQFLDCLYIFSEQGNEVDVGKRLKDEITTNQVTNKNASIFQNTPEAVYEKFHLKVQEWMLLTGSTFYLTNNCNFLEDKINIINPYLSMLNNNCIMELQSHPLKINIKSTIKLFSKLDDRQARTSANIVSNDVLLTGTKLMKYFSDKKCLFVKFHDVYIMNNVNYKKFLEEVNEATIKTLVIIYETETYTTEKLMQIVNGFSNNTLLVSERKFECFEIIYDNINGLDDIDNEDEFLKQEIIVQGKEVKLENVIEENKKNLINTGILYKIIKNEKIEIGQSLSNPVYEELRDCFVERKVSNHDGDGCELRSYKSKNIKVKNVTQNVVVITAEPGMGKSTLLTHLSIKMKCSNPKTWIVRMNLLNYCSDFKKLHKKEINKTESMHLVCKAELKNEHLDKHFSIKDGPDGDLVLVEEKKLDPTTLLHLKLVINCFNEGNIIFLFDGFDEICPDYGNVVIQFMKNIVRVDNSCEHLRLSDHKRLREINSGNHILITTRPYNAIIQTLKSEFKIEPFYLQHISKNEQINFYKRYWETQLLLEELNSEQFKNVEDFFDQFHQFNQLQQYDMYIYNAPSSSSLPRRIMEEAAIDYIRSKLVTSTKYNVIDKQKLLNKWISSELIQSVELAYSLLDKQYDKSLLLAGIPLHMKIYADFFVSEITDTSSTKKWNLNVHTSEFFKRFLETKLKQIRLEEKSGEKGNTPTSRMQYDELVAEVTEEHKKLAFYALFHNKPRQFKKVLRKKQWIQIKNMIERIAKAQEKTGLIDRIHKRVPQFVHSIFAEYYAVELIADMLKMEVTNKKVQIKFLVNCLLKSSEQIMSQFNKKISEDEELQKALSKNDTRKHIFTVWMKQHNKIEKCGGEESEIESSLVRVMYNGWKDAAWILLKSIKDNLNSCNIESFVDFIGFTFFVLALKLKCTDLVEYVLDNIRCVDPSMVVKVINICGLETDDKLPNNDCIIYNMCDRFRELGAIHY